MLSNVYILILDFSKCNSSSSKEIKRDEKGRLDLE